jgi:predicted nucleic acid-binding protein
MSNRVFFDTNVLIYFFGEAGRRTPIAERLVWRGGVISIQVLNELASVAHGKLGMSWDEVRSARDKALIFCPDPVPLTLRTHLSAVEISSRYGYAIYDGLILASALEAGCATLYTEDMQHGQIIGGLRIENPFLLAAAP